MALSYTKKAWVDSEIVKAVDANKWENGINDGFSIAECGAGKVVSGFIEDGGQHNVGDVWLSRNNKGTFKCTVANTDNFIDVAKWLQIDDLTNATKLENLNAFRQESLTIPTGGGTAYFIKMGNIGFISINNLYQTDDKLPALNINYPSWFVVKQNVTGVLASDLGPVAECTATQNYLTVNYAQSTTRPGISGCIVVPLA